MDKYCRKCGNAINPHTGQCDRCACNIPMRNASNSQADYSQQTTKKKSPRKRTKAIIAVMCVIVFGIAGTLGVLLFIKSREDVVIENISSSYVSFNEGFTDVLITDEQSAIEAVASVGDILGIEDANSELEVTQVNKIGSDTYYRLQQYYYDIPMYGRNISVVADENGNSLALTANSTHIKDIDIQPALDEEDIAEIIEKKYDGVDEQINNGLVIYNLYDAEPALAYDITVTKVTDEQFIYEECLVSAEDGEILFRNSLINTEIAHSASEYTYKVNDNTYLMYDSTREFLVLNSNEKLLEFKKVIQNGKEYLRFTNDGKTNENPNPLWDNTQIFICGDLQIEGSKDGKWNNNAVNLANAVENTYDFYLEILQRNGYDDNNGQMIMSYNDYFYEEGNNAYSCGSIMVFGYQKDLTDVELIAHEFTHSVENKIVGMNYVGESGAIMEAYSDVFGELVEDYAEDGKMNNDCDWIHGKRNIKNPNENNYPTTYKDNNWGATTPEYNEKNESTNDNGHVHKNNTVISHAAYLMNQGVDGNEKIGTESLAHLWYNSFNLLQKDSNFTQCRNAVEMSARMMVNNNQLTAEQYKTVQAAFDKVRINSMIVYPKTVKNNFELSVLNCNGNENIDYKLRVVKILDENRRPSSEYPKVIIKGKEVSGRESLDLEDGTYIFTITDASKNSTAQPIQLRITVDGNTKTSVDEIVVYTDFLETSFENNSQNENLNNSGGQAVDDANTLFYEYLKQNKTLAPIGYPKAAFSVKDQGVISALIRDFDHDGKEEMVTVSIIEQDECFDGIALVFDSYQIQDNVVKHCSSSEVFHTVMPGNSSKVMCAEYVDNKIRFYTFGWGYGGSSDLQEWIGFLIEDGQLVEEYHFSAYHRYGFNIMEGYEDEVSQKKYSSEEELKQAVKAAGFNDDNFEHLSAYETLEDYESAIEDMKGNHIFVLGNDSWSYEEDVSYIYDNTNLRRCMNLYGNNKSTKE